MEDICAITVVQARHEQISMYIIISIIQIMTWYRTLKLKLQLKSSLALKKNQDFKKASWHVIYPQILLEVQLPYASVCPSIGRFVHWSVCHNFLKGRKSYISLLLPKSSSSMHIPDVNKQSLCDIPNTFFCISQRRMKEVVKICFFA